jgi:hypothetical protein
MRYIDCKESGGLSRGHAVSYGVFQAVLPRSRRADCQVIHELLVRLSNIESDRHTVHDGSPASRLLILRNSASGLKRFGEPTVYLA